MHGRTRSRTATKLATRRNAVVWIGPGRALVLRDAEAGGLDESEIPLPDAMGATPTALAQVAHCVRDVDRVLVLGRDDLRTALEREIVAISHAPETIREAEIEGPVNHDVLLARLRRLA